MSYEEEVKEDDLIEEEVDEESTEKLTGVDVATRVSSKIMSDSEDKKLVPYNYLPDDDVEMLADAFKLAFSDQVAAIHTRNVRALKTSAAVYLPLEFKDCVATVIIWKNKHRYLKKGKIYRA